MRQLILKTSNIIKVELFLFGVTSSLALPALGQAHLEPAKDRSKYSGSSKIYYDYVFDRLLKRMSDKPLARYLVLTSFSPEYVLSLEEIDTSNYILKYGTFNKKLSYTKNRPKARLKYKEMAIDKEFAILIKQLFQTAVSKIEVPKEKIWGFDGANYLFSTYNAESGLVTGEIWSPRKNTKMRELVDLCEKYKSLIIKKDKGDALILPTRKLIQRLK